MQCGDVNSRCLNFLSLSVYCLFLSACAVIHSDWNPQVYIVKPKDTLYSIAWRYRLDYRDIARWNNISHPYTIRTGDRLLLSDSGKALQTKIPAPLNGNDSISINRESIRMPVTEVVAENSVLNWQWPAQGKIIRFFESDKISSQGIDISGHFRQAVLAAAGGRVVYSGEGLIGYGKLLIIKHNEMYLSAYAHNHAVFVMEGDEIKTGQHIAEMGITRGGQAQLHFEIRKLGKPVDPMKYLPKP